MVTADDELIDALSDTPSNLKARRSIKGISIEGLTERTVDNIQMADEALAAIAEKRNTVLHAHSHSVSFLRIFTEGPSMHTQRTVFLSFVDLGSSTTTQFSETTRAVDLRRAQRIQKTISSISDALIGLQRFQVAPPTSSMLSFVLQDFWNPDSLIQIFFWISALSANLYDSIKCAEYAASCRSF